VKDEAMAESERPERVQATVFGEVADLYHRVRPSYPAALVDDVLAATASQPPRVLEVGSGTGKATLLFAPRAARIVCIEPDAAMADVARAMLADAANVEIVNTRFEDWSAGDDRFDLVISAQAWHWVEPVARTRNARAAVADDGVLALFWNHPNPEQDPLYESLNAVYRECAPEIAGEQWPTHAILRAVDETRDLADSGLFGPLEEKRYHWATQYTTAQYLDLIQTHSNHRLLDPAVLARLLDRIGRAIDEAGGERTVRYTTWLGLARPV
jgi:SAM-dependent methyltransferase